jgi:hypothetical protein
MFVTAKFWSSLLPIDSGFLFGVSFSGSRRGQGCGVKRSPIRGDSWGKHGTFVAAGGGGGAEAE